MTSFAKVSVEVKDDKVTAEFSLPDGSIARKAGELLLRGAICGSFWEELPNQHKEPGARFRSGL